MRVILLAVLLIQTVYGFECRDSSLYRELQYKKNKCKTKKVHLTFDDGPDTNVTPKIMQALNKRGVKATFYVSTHHLKPKTKNATLMNLIKSGHVVASHGHEHHAHDLRLVKRNGRYYCEHVLSAEESERQIELSLQRLDEATDGLMSQQKHQLFRFPFGRGALPSNIELDLINRYGHNDNACEKIAGQTELPLCQDYGESLANYRQYQSEPLKRVHAQGSDHVGWNFDSRDSESAIMRKAKEDPYWYKEHILNGLCDHNAQSIMTLFHDQNKMFNAEAMPDIIDIGRCLGIQFVSYDELLKEKEYLVRTGVLQPAPRMTSDSIGNLISRLELDRQEPNLNPICGDDPNLSSGTCRSNNGKEYLHCEGETSICVNGSWMAKSNVEEVGRHCPQIYKTCFSEYAKRSFRHCEGSSSICINGVWFNRNSYEAEQYCL